ncbi:MAG TPA: hypothetical protein VMH00_14085 [Candidatus Limnocylindrales bacterium]|nr:hypothetical protein [Candidatus Limnocylindrales bacterium]
MILLLADLGEVAPVAGLAALAAAGVYFLFRKKPQDPSALERERRAYLNRIGRIVEGHILEVVDGSHAPPPPKPLAKQPGLLGKRPVAAVNGAQKLLYYSYSISGVTYETAQDVTGLEEQAHLKRVSVGQSASVKYDPSNPSNSILLADDWSGIH